MNSFIAPILFPNGGNYLFYSSPPLQVRDRLPHLKAIVQYKGKLSQEYPDVYEVTFTHI